jgi:hypothetical protein
MGRECSGMEEKRNAYRILVGKPEGKRPLGRPRHRCLDNIKIDLKEIGLIWLRIGTVKGPCEHGNETLSSIKCWEVLE